MRIKISAVMIGLALGFSAWAARGTGCSYREMAGLVPSASRSAAYIDFGMVAASGWYEKLAAVPGIGDWLRDLMPSRGALIMSYDEKKQGIVAFIAFSSGYAISLDDIAEMKRAYLRKHGVEVEITRYVLVGHPALSVVPSDGGSAVYFVQLDSRRVLLAVRERAASDYLKLKPEQLGINPELEARLAGNADKAVFGSFMVPGAPGGGLQRFDVYATLDRTDPKICLIMFGSGKKPVKYTRKYLARAKSSLLAGMNSNRPGIGDLLDPAITVAANGGNIVLTLKLSAELLEKCAAGGSGNTEKNIETKNTEVKNEKD